MHIIIGILVICVLLYLLVEYWAVLLIASVVGGFIFYFLQKRSKENARPTPDDERLHLPGRLEGEAPRYPANYIYDFWPRDALCSSASRDRLERAKTQDLEIKSVNNYGIAFIKGSTGTIYKTSLHSCTCKDFENHKKPCKHILKFALYTGALDKDDDLYGIPEEVDARFQSLSKAAQKELLGLIYSHGHQVNERFIVNRSTNLDSLIMNGFVIENVDPEYFLSNTYTVSEMRAILKEYQNRTGIKISKSSDSKSVLIQNIINAGDDCLNLFTLQKILLEFDPEIAPHAISLYDKYSK